MQHLRSLPQESLGNTWLTIGSFDGVHLGHQEIIRHLVMEAHGSGGTAVVLTFDPHPAVVLGVRQLPYYLSSVDERAELLGSLGVDLVITQQFDLTLANTSAREYMLSLHAGLGIEQLWVGSDFALGRNREGDVKFLQDFAAEMNFKLQVIDPIQIDGHIISSSQIRNLIQAGEIQQAARMLGRHYQVEGVVIPGDQRGRTIGIPTANLKIDPEKILPANGVYACQAFVRGQAWPAATNIGIRPTFDGQSLITHVEAHLIGFTGNLYGELIRLECIERLRGEQRFASIDALVAQIHQDLAQTMQIVRVVF